MEKIANKNNKEELIKLMQENPDLPLVFLVDNDKIAYDYGSTVYENFYCYITKIYDDGDMYYDDFDEIHDKYRDNLCDEEGFKDIKDDDEYDKAVDKWINENTRHYEAIVIWVD